MAKTETLHRRLVILGAGPAGYTAAIYAARANLAPLLVAGLQPGGQLTITTDVENYPGFADVIQGPWLMEQMAAQARHVGTEVVDDLIVQAELSRRPFRLIGVSGRCAGDRHRGESALAGAAVGAGAAGRGGFGLRHL